MVRPLDSCQRWVASLVLCGLAVVLSACWSSNNRYTTAQTLEAGEYSLAVAFHGWWVPSVCATFDEPDRALNVDCVDFEGANQEASNLGGGVLPELAFRMGLTDEVDWGVHATVLGLHVDVRQALLDLPEFDLAMGVGLHAKAIAVAEAGAHFPLIATVRPVEWFAVTGAASMIVGTMGEFGRDGVFLGLLGWSASAGLSVDVPVERDTLFIRPEVTHTSYETVFAGPDTLRDTDIAFWTLGIGGGFEFR